ncbi:MAG: TlpA disulfide reductase family protein [Myxococcota bacterium]
MLQHPIVKGLSWFAIACAVALAPACASTSGATAGANEIRPFRLSDLGGDTVDLAQHLGKDVVLISFWATYCEPCKAEMPFLQGFHDRYKTQGLAVVSVSIDGPETQAEVAPYIRKQGYTFPVVIDKDGAVAQSLNPTTSAPYAIIVGRDGKVRKRISGFQGSEAPELEKELQALLAEPAGTTQGSLLRPPASGLRPLWPAGSEGLLTGS